MQLTADLSNLPLGVRERVCRNLKHEDQAQYALACIEQAKAASFYRQAVQAGTTKSEVGPLQMAIHPYFRNQLSATASAQRELIWSDPDFAKWLLLRNEEFRVPEARTKISSGWTPESARAEVRSAAPLESQTSKLEP